MGLVRMGTSTLQRLAQAIRRSERIPTTRPRDLRGSGQSLLFVPYPDQIIAIELDEDIPESHNSNDEYDGLMLRWDPSADSSKGAYTSSGATSITLRDTLEMIIYGSDGARGVARIKFDGNGKWFGELLGLECP